MHLIRRLKSDVHLLLIELMQVLSRGRRRAANSTVVGRPNIGENFYLVIDLEATFCDRWTVPSDQMEFIEIGAVMVDGNGLRLIDVRPSRHLVLHSPYIDRAIGR